MAPWLKSLVEIITEYAVDESASISALAAEVVAVLAWLAPADLLPADSQ